MVADLAIFSACFKLYLTGQCVRTIKNTCPPLLILTDELIGKTGLQTASAQAMEQSEVHEAGPIWFSEPLDEEAFGYWGMHEVSLHGSQITSSRMAARVPARKCRVSSKTMLAGYATPVD